jgi:gas vesicle structural protein
MRFATTGRLMTPPAESPSTGASIIDVLDHVLDKGIVIDAWVRVSLAGIDLITVEARVLVASIETYLHHSNDVANAGRLVGGGPAQQWLTPAAPRPRVRRAIVPNRRQTTRSKGHLR